MAFNGILQRIESIPTSTLRGIQLQQSAAHFAVQNLMDFETVNLIGKVMVRFFIVVLVNQKYFIYCAYYCYFKLTDVVELAARVIAKNSCDYGVSYSCAVLISLCIDLDDETQSRVNNPIN